MHAKHPKDVPAEYARAGGDLALNLRRAYDSGKLLVPRVEARYLGANPDIPKLVGAARD